MTMTDASMQQLRCPKCGGGVTLTPYDAASGVLTCACGAAYPVYRGVPRMLPRTTLPRDFHDAWIDRLRNDAPSLAALPSADPQADFSFSFQWAQHSYDELTWEVFLPERLEVFYAYTGMSRDGAHGVRLLDAGCGNGTLSAELAKEGFDVTGLDFSDSVSRARERTAGADRLRFVQGDVTHPPFPDAAFDLIYSDGVLHHTPSTKRAFLALAPKVRPGGRFFVWLYRSDGKLGYRLKMSAVKLLWKITGGWSFRAKWRLCMTGAFVIMSALRVLRLFGYRKRRVLPLRLKALNLFDTISPTYNHEHTAAEVMEWYKEAGYVDVRDVTVSKYRLAEGGFGVIGTRA